MKVDIPYWYLHQSHGGTAGHTFGYTTLIAGLGSSLLREGVEITPDADIRLSTWMLEPDIDVNEKRTWCFTMWESPDVPPSLVTELNKFERLLVPSTAVKRWFIASGISRPVHVVPLAVDDRFTHQLRMYRPLALEPFRFLWLGAATHRKMLGHAIMMFRKAFEGRIDVELYIKTTVIDGQGNVVIDNPTDMIGPNIILDKRVMTREELLRLYHSAHAFLHTCSMEGFGLPVAEAMKTGCLVIAPQRGGLRDFVDETTALLMPLRPHQMIVTWGQAGQEPNTYMTDSWMPNREEGVNVLRRAVTDYARTAEMRRRGADRIATQFTWQRTARAVMELVGRYRTEGAAA